MHLISRLPYKQTFEIVFDITVTLLLTRLYTSLQIKEILDCLLALVGLASEDDDNVSVMNTLGALQAIFFYRLIYRILFQRNILDLKSV